MLKKIALALITATCLFSATTQARSIKANECSLALLPFGLTMAVEAQKDEILEAYSKKGYFVTPVTSIQSAASHEFYADASLDCSLTYFGMSAQTTLRLVNSNTNTIITRIQTPVVLDMFTCKIELLKAIAELPNCSVR